MLSYFLATSFLPIVLLITQASTCLEFDGIEDDASCLMPTNLDGELLINGTIFVDDATISVLPGGLITLLCHAEQKALCLENGTWSLKMVNCSTFHRPPLSDDHLQRWLTTRVTVVNPVTSEIPSDDQFVCELEEPIDAIYTITDGQVNQAGFVTAGSKIKMICDNPIDIIRYGSDISECLEDGYLTEEFGICKRSRRRSTTTTVATTTVATHCHVPDINGAVMKSVEVGIGESFAVACFSDYFVHGVHNESLCKENGQFEPPLGRCVTKSVIHAVRNRLHDDLSILAKDYLPNEMIDIDEKDVDGWTGLMWAVTLDDFWSFQLLLNNSASCNILNNVNTSALLYASKNGNIAMVRMLINAGATINQTNIYGLSPLHVAIRQFHLAVAEILIQAGADISVNDGYGFPPLVWSARVGSLPFVNLLLANGANVDVVGAEEHETALIAASKIGSFEVVQYLLEAGADETTVDIYGMTAKHYASIFNHNEVLDIIQKYAWLRQNTGDDDDVGDDDDDDDGIFLNDNGNDGGSGAAAASDDDAIVNEFAKVKSAPPYQFRSAFRLKST